MTAPSLIRSCLKISLWGLKLSIHTLWPKATSSKSQENFFSHFKSAEIHRKIFFLHFKIILQILFHTGGWILRKSICPGYDSWFRELIHHGHFFSWRDLLAGSSWRKTKYGPLSALSGYLSSHSCLSVTQYGPRTVGSASLHNSILVLQWFYQKKQYLMTERLKNLSINA